jgi:hypothetical protein
MGFLGKLFGGEKKPPFEMQPTAILMDEDRYWKLIADSLAATTDDEQDEQEKHLVTALENLEPADIVGFRLRTDKLLYDTYNSDIWCAGYIMNGGCSDDGFEYFRLWIISRGREVYENAKADPDSLATVHGGTVEGFYDFESLWYVANKAFEKKTGKDLYNYIDYDNFKTSEGNYPEFEFTWAEEDPESRKKICPNLFARFENAFN